MSPSLPLASEPDFEEGALIDRLRVLERVDSGSYGVVYRGVMAYRLVTNTYPPAPTDPKCADAPERLRPAKLVAPPGPPRWHRRALALLKRWRVPTAAVAVLVLASVVALHFDDEPPRMACGEEPGMSPDSETVGLGDTPLVSAAPFSDVSGSERAVGLDMPPPPAQGAETTSVQTRRG